MKQPHNIDKSAEQKAEEEERKQIEAARAKAKLDAERDDKSLVSTETSADRAAAKEDKTAKKITVTFTGDPKGGRDPESPEYEGKLFPKGKAVVVDDAQWIRRYGDQLRQNNHFRVE